MGATLDGQNIFTEHELVLERGSIRQNSTERTVPGLDGVLSICLGGSSRKIKQKGVLRSESRPRMDEKIKTISGYMDGNTHTLKTSSGEEFEHLRMDSFRVSKEGFSGNGLWCDYEIIYTQLTTNTAQV